MGKGAVLLTAAICLLWNHVALHANDSFTTDSVQNAEILLAKCNTPKSGPPGPQGPAAKQGFASFGSYYFIGPVPSLVPYGTPVPYNNTVVQQGCQRNADGSVTIIDPTPGLNFWLITYGVAFFQLIPVGPGGPTYGETSSLFLQRGGGAAKAIPGSGINTNIGTTDDRDNTSLLTLSIIVQLQTGDVISVQSLDRLQLELALRNADPWCSTGCKIPPSYLVLMKVQSQ